MLAGQLFSLFVLGGAVAAIILLIRHRAQFARWLINESGRKKDKKAIKDERKQLKRLLEDTEDELEELDEKEKEIEDEPKP